VLIVRFAMIPIEVVGRFAMNNVLLYYPLACIGTFRLNGFTPFTLNRVLANMCFPSTTCMTPEGLSSIYSRILHPFRSKHYDPIYLDS
jgi:hypothetical protein